MSDRSEAAVARIREVVPILQVLASYGYGVRDDGGDREQQFSCDLHGTGRDTKPSARVYPESGSWYCFACDATRDAIGTVMAKDGLKFWDAVGALEKAYGLEALPRDFGTGQEYLTKTMRVVNEILDPTRTFEQDATRARKFLDNRTLDRDLPMAQLLLFWEKFDETLYYVEEVQTWTEDKGRVVLGKLLSKINEVIKTQREAS